jgi:hypothetical protein
MFRNHLFITFCLYFLLSGLIIYLKPNLIFKNKNISKFGVGNNKTLLPLWLVLILLAIMSYILSVIILIKTN